MIKKMIFLLKLLLTPFLFFAVPAIVQAQPLVLDGVIEPSLIVKVGSPVAGVLDNVRVERGDMVTAGQTLASLQSGVERATMELARARAGMDSFIKAKETKYEYSLREQKRMEQLYEQALISFEALDESKTGSALAFADLEEARDNKKLAEMEWKRSEEILKRLTISSPISGVVMDRFLAAGEYVENQPIVQLARIDPLHVEVFAPVGMLGTIRPGMKVQVAPEKPRGSFYTATVRIVDRVVDAASGTFGIRLELPNPKEKLSAGLKCRVTFPKAD
jgi:RND family efflux transporter MFP subunit